ncbi:MAG: hypothetical protein J3R72DRAFT_452083 [Linnemannia gamsii]|nr:MAG: hypothetical protein J3R72DRAFT_452083 [Linnemannia gamsii]
MQYHILVVLSHCLLHTSLFHHHHLLPFSFSLSFLHPLLLFALHFLFLIFIRLLSSKSSLCVYVCVRLPSFCSVLHPTIDFFLYVNRETCKMMT